MRATDDDDRERFQPIGRSDTANKLGALAIAHTHIRQEQIERVQIQELPGDAKAFGELQIARLTAFAERLSHEMSVSRVVFYNKDVVVSGYRHKDCTYSNTHHEVSRPGIPPIYVGFSTVLGPLS